MGRIFSFFDIVQDIVLVIFVYFVMSNISSNVFFLSKSQHAEWSTLGLDELRRVCEVQCVTNADISALDFVTLHGYRLMLIEGDRDEETRLTNFKGLTI